jgi:hypothetical protein
MKHSGLGGLLLSSVLLCGFLLHLAYSEVKNEAIDQLNSQQLLLAGEAARGIERFFDRYTGLLREISQMSSVSRLDDHGKQLMRIFHQLHADEITSMARTNARVPQCAHQTNSARP